MRKYELLLVDFYKLYEEDRKTGAPQNFIDYFKARSFLLEAANSNYQRGRTDTMNALLSNFTKHSFSDPFMVEIDSVMEKYLRGRAEELQINLLPKNE